MNNVNLLINAGINVNASLQLFGDIETYNEILKGFLDKVNDMVSNLKKYKEIADMNNYSILVHSLKSDSKYFGFDKLAEMALQHEMESKSNNIYYVYDNFDSLMEELNRILSVVYEYFGEERNIKTSEEIKEKKGTLLVVDDSVVISNFINKLFNNEYEIIIAKDGTQAITTINKIENITGMLLDLNMPNVNGFEVLEFMSLRGLFDKIPTAVITGIGRDEAIEQVKLYPIVDVLRKPFNEKDVKEVIEKIVTK